MSIVVAGISPYKEQKKAGDMYKNHFFLKVISIPNMGFELTIPGSRVIYSSN